MFVGEQLKKVYWESHQKLAAWMQKMRPLSPAPMSRLFWDRLIELMGNGDEQRALKPSPYLRNSRFRSVVQSLSAYQESSIDYEKVNIAICNKTEQKYSYSAPIPGHPFHRLGTSGSCLLLVSTWRSDPGWHHENEPHWRRPWAAAGLPLVQKKSLHGDQRRWESLNLILPKGRGSGSDVEQYSLLLTARPNGWAWVLVLCSLQPNPKYSPECVLIFRLMNIVHSFTIR